MTGRRKAWFHSEPAPVVNTLQHNASTYLDGYAYHRVSGFDGETWDFWTELDKAGQSFWVFRVNNGRTIPVEFPKDVQAVDPTDLGNHTEPNAWMLNPWTYWPPLV